MQVKHLPTFSCAQKFFSTTHLQIKCEDKNAFCWILTPGGHDEAQPNKSAAPKTNTKPNTKKNIQSKKLQ